MGALAGIRIVEFVGLGPGPFAAMMLADHGAEVIRVDRPGRRSADHDFLARGRRSIALDLKRPEAVAVALRLVARADGLIEGFRPGVMERLGLGPEICRARHPRLVYGRMTGWGQAGPLAHAAGHDINYLALSGALHAIGPAGGPPVPPLNLVADFGGGGMMLAFGMVCALLEAGRSGNGQVIDAAMTDGAALLMASTYARRANGQWSGTRGDNLLDGGAPFYGVYRCADDRYVAIGALEPQFHGLLLEKLAIVDPEFARRDDRARWPSLRAKLAAVFAARTRAEWCARLEGSDVCFAPVLGLDEAPAHAHNATRGTFMTRDGHAEPAPAPRLACTPAEAGAAAAIAGEHGAAILADWGFAAEEIAALARQGMIEAS
jgi:alpha-methylacyl-CoA racemase